MTTSLSIVLPLAVLMVPVAGAIERAAARVMLSKKALAIAMGISQAQLSRELAGEGHIALDRLERTPINFRQALIEELCALWGCERPLTARDVLDLIQRVLPASLRELT